MTTDPLPALLEAAATRGLELEGEDVRFALQFSGLMLDIALADREFLPSERSAMVDALDNWTGLGLEAIDLVIDHARGERAAARGADEVREAAAAFAREHGQGPALLLLDCLFGVATAEGEISGDELARIQDVAAALEVDEVLLKRFQQRWTPSDVRGDAVIALAGDRMTIGRAEDCAVRLEDPDVAAHHATLVHRDGAWWIEAVSAETPTLVEDRPITRERLGAADRVRIGGFVLRLVEDRSEVHVFAATAASALTVRDLSVSVPVADGRKTILDGISFTALAGELIALIGPSGSGKTTLLTAISGIRTLDRGEVLLDGESFHALLAGNRNLVGEVPQEDIVHPTLTVGESLWYSARLRLAQDLRDSEVRQEVDRVLGELDIEAIRDSLIGDATRRGISGGQRKRVNLGQELLSRSTHVLFLDEPTSGLDPHGTQEIVNLVRDLADHDRIVFLVTHDLGSRIVKQVDQLLVLTRGGRLAFFGPPEEACAHFGVARVDEIFAAIQDEEPEEVAGRYRESGAWRRYVTTREKVLGIGPARKTGALPASPPQPGRLRQLGFLARRYARVKWRDRGGMAILLLQAPVLALLMAIVFPKVDPSALFIVSLATLWFGCSASVREVIAELPILRRERRAGLRLLPYLASKTAVLPSGLG